MKTTSKKFIPILRLASVAVCLLAMFSATALALTVEREVTSAYVRDHPREFSVTVTKDKDGLIHFTIKHSVAQPMYHVAHLAIHHQGKLVATSDTPLFGKKQDNTFYFSISAEDVVESQFDLSDSSVSGSADDAVPMPGTTVHQFRLLSFVPQKLLGPVSKK